jgi:hypothetical protein
VPNDSARQTVTRRGALRWLSAGVVASIAGCGTPSSDVETEPTSEPPLTTNPDPTTTAQPTPSALDDLDRSSFSTFVDFGDLDDVADAARSITPLLEEHVTDNSLCYLPPGRYLMSKPWNLRDFENVAIVGDDATIELPAGYSRNLFSPGPDRATGFRLEGLTFDFRNENTGGRVLHAKVADDLLVRDVTVRGKLDVEQNLFRIDVTDPDGSALVEKLYLPDGAAPGTGASGCLVGDSNRGNIRFADCEMRGFPDNALYASADHGTIEVFGGTYANSGISNVRVRGDSHIRGVHVLCDRAPDKFRNMRGIRIRGGSNVLVEDCTVEMLDATYSDGAITIAPWADGATIRNTEVRTDADNVVSLRAKPLVEESGPEASLDIENVTFSGNARNGATVQVTERDSINVRDVCIRERGENRDGIDMEDARDVSIEDTYIDVPGVPIRAESSQYVTSNVQTSASDDLPDSC